MPLTCGGKCLVPGLSGFGQGHGGRQLLLADCSPTATPTPTSSSPSADTHHVPLLHTVATLNEGRASGYTAACRGDVTLRPSKDGVGPWLTPFLPIPTILQGNSVRVSTAPSILMQPPPTPPSSLWPSHLFASLPTMTIKELNKKINISFAPIRLRTGGCHGIRLREFGQTQERGKDGEGKPEEQEISRAFRSPTPHRVHT